MEELKREIMAARRLRKKEDAKEQAKNDISTAEAAKEKEYRDRGDVLECGTCCDDLPTYKFTHCDGDNPHFLCFGCLQSYANTEIGNQRYALDCLHEEYVYLSLQTILPFKFSSWNICWEYIHILLIYKPTLTASPIVKPLTVCPLIVAARQRIAAKRNNELSIPKHSRP